MEIPVGESLGQWLENKCRIEKLSLRQAAAKTGLSHATLHAIINGSRPLPETVRKLASGFSGNHQSSMALEDHLLILADYRTARPGEASSEPLAQLLDKLAGFSRLQLEVIGHFADFILETERK